MKHRFWFTAAATIILWGSVPGLVQAQQSDAPVPHSPSHPENASPLLPEGSPAVPSRRVPSLTPPQPGERHPVTPDEAWPKYRPSDKPGHPSPESGTEDDKTDEMPFSKDPLTDQPANAYPAKTPKFQQ